ncbi:MAG: aquaporin, partial [Planctomycetota bacterium]
MAPIGQRLLAELLGTFMLVLAAVGSAAAGEGLFGQALANGLVLSVLVASFAGISGAHFNPAVTVAFTLVGKSRPADAGPYVLTQCVAATLAAAAVAWLYPDGAAAVARGAALPAVSPVWAAKLVGGEALITFLLMVAIYGTMIDTRGPAAKIGGFGVGFVVAANILAAGPATGASMNPARSFGPALVTGDFGLHWCYWLGPMVGAVAGAIAYEKLLTEPPAVDEQTPSRTPPS